MAKKPAIADTKSVTSFGKVYNLFRESWPEYVIEVIVIIFSITISFAFDEWKDNRRKKELEQTYLKGLYSDIETDLSQLQEVISETQQVIQKAKSLSDVNSQAPISDYNQLASTVRFVFKRPRFIAEDATFSDLKSTGNMQVISSFPLKKSIFDYYKQYETIVQVETAELETTNMVVAPYVLRRFPLAEKANNAPKTNWAAIMGEAEFQNALLIRRSTREELLRDYQQSLKLGKKILALIKSKMN
ncbi:hypothetical protein EXU85_07100 [Spirosoma sp. KCTC 42546]|uniref:hypothetical protein n=1 Tax=Spirosoma sp. KCTC 42546 TaxID=2520506 RepID=UPI00115B3390|nr:hypothetical protein [Spirosoma sp. KCTC 42546]QDK78382.1 hypothetical protein EXU85_07100 [Spirosoma sp. KCTC 42546]